MRKCYPAIVHQEGDVIRVRDCILLRSGRKKFDLPFVAKVTALWENPDDGRTRENLFHAEFLPPRGFIRFFFSFYPQGT
jgi:hypothetical protein